MAAVRRDPIGGDLVSCLSGREGCEERWRSGAFLGICGFESTTMVAESVSEKLLSGARKHWTPAHSSRWKSAEEVDGRTGGYRCRKRSIESSGIVP